MKRRFLLPLLLWKRGLGRGGPLIPGANSLSVWRLPRAGMKKVFGLCMPRLRLPSLHPSTTPLLHYSITPSRLSECLGHHFGRPNAALVIQNDVHCFLGVIDHFEKSQIP